MRAEMVRRLGADWCRRWFEGLRPTCAVGEDWSQPLGTAREPLLATALLLAAARRVVTGHE